MTPATFNRWLSDMKSEGIATSARQCAKLLGISSNAIYTMKRDGVKGQAAHRTALACRAVLHRLEPYE